MKNQKTYFHVGLAFSILALIVLGIGFLYLSMAGNPAGEGGYEVIFKIVLLGWGFIACAVPALLFTGLAAITYRPARWLLLVAVPLGLFAGWLALSGLRIEAQP